MQDQNISNIIKEDDPNSIQIQENDKTQSQDSPQKIEQNKSDNSNQTDQKKEQVEIINEDFQMINAMNDSQKYNQIIDNDSDDQTEYKHQQAQYYQQRHQAQAQTIQQQPTQMTFSSRLQQTSRRQIQMQEQVKSSLVQDEQSSANDAYPIQMQKSQYDLNNVSKFRVAMIASTFGEAEALTQYINGYLCDRRLYIREWQTHFRIAAFIAQWLHLTLPKQLVKFQNLHLNSEKQSHTNHSIPCGTYSKLFSCLFTLLNQSQEIYNFRYSNNSLELLQKLVKYNQENFSEQQSFDYLKDEYLQKPVFNVSIFFINTLQNFAKCGGFELLILAISNNRNQQILNQDSPADTNHKIFIPSMYFLAQVVELIYSVKEYLRQEYYNDLVRKVLEACLSFSKNKQDKESLRHVNKRDLMNFINRIEKLQNGLNNQSQKQGLNQVEQDQQNNQITELIELELALRCLRMPILEKKFIGHSILTQKINQVLSRNVSQDYKSKIIFNEPDQINSESQINKNAQQKNQSHQKLIDKEFLIEWMDKNGIFNTIFGESLHPEVIKKSYFLLEFLYKNGKIQEAQIDLMWKCAIQKHEVYRNEILKALISLSSKAEFNELKFMLKLIHTIPLNHTDKFIMLFLKTIAQNISSRISGVNQDPIQIKKTNLDYNSSRRMRMLMDPTRLQQNQNGNSKGNLGQRRMSDVGIQQSKMMENNILEKQTFQNKPFEEDLFKVSPWDDHDITNKNKQSSNLYVDSSLKDQTRVQRNRSSSFTKKNDMFKITTLENNFVQKQKEVQVQQLQENENKKKEDEEENDEISNFNITDVPAEKEDKNTADEDYSPKQNTLYNVDNNQYFDNDSQDNFQDSKSQNLYKYNLDSNIQAKDIIKVKLNVHHQEEEKKQESQQQNAQKEQNTFKISVKQFLFDLHINVESSQKKSEDQIDQQKKNEYKKLGINVLKLMWSYCMEDIVIPNQVQNLQSQPSNLNINDQSGIRNHDFDQNIENRVGQISHLVYQTTIDSFCQVINRDFPLTSFFFINLCVQNLKRNYSVISSQKILQKLIQETQFPILNFEKDQINKDKSKLPKNQEELIIALDNDLKLTNECLSSYVEFKRNSVQLIFEQFGDLDNELIGVIGEQVENLETQSSLDNNTNQTGEERSRFSQSIESSTQKSDTADYFTNISRSHQKSNHQRRVQQPHSNQIVKTAERGQSFPKIQPQQTSKQESQQESSFSMNILGEPNSSSFNTSSKILQDDKNKQQNLEQVSLDQICGIQQTNSHQVNNSGFIKQQSIILQNPKIKEKQEEKKQGSFKFDQQKNIKVNEFQIKADTNIQQEEIEKQQKKSSIKLQNQENPLVKQIEAQKDESQGTSSDLQSNNSDSQASQAQSLSEKISQNTASNPQNQNRQFLNGLITNRAFQLNFIQEMNQRIEFFKFLTKNSQCQTLKAPQINILWECLVVNAFNEEERDLFFVLCSDLLNSAQLNELKKLQKLSMDQDFDQQQDQNIADALLFEEDVFELIFYEILLRLDYRSQENAGGFTLSMYNCFERFFLYVNERYGQIETKSRSRGILNEIYSPQIQIVVYDHQLIGIEALWEIILGAQDERIYKKASAMLMKLFKNLATDNENEAAPNIKELFYQNCLNQIKVGLKDIDGKNTQLLKASHFNRNEINQAQNRLNLLNSSNNFESNQKFQNENLNIGQLQNQLHPDLANSVSIDESRNRISRSLSLLSQFIIDFEIIKGKRNDQGEKNRQSAQVAIIVNNQISNTRGPSKINLNLPSHTKINELKDLIGKSLVKQQLGRELCLIYRGKELNEDLKTLKDLGMISHMPNGIVEPIKILLTLKSSLDLQVDNIQDSENEAFNQEQLMESVETLKMFLEDLKASNDVIKLALKKCKMNLEEAILMLTNPDQVIDLEDEVRQDQEVNQQAQIMSNINLKADNLNKEDEIIQEQEEIKLSEMISNRGECFDLLINLLNLGISEITQASWSLLSQVPVNQKLLNQIRLLQYDPVRDQKGEQFIIASGDNQKKSGLMSEAEWKHIIDPDSTHKMLYSLQLVNQLITINNEKLTELEIQERFNWRQRFLELGGFNHLYKILLSYNFDQLEEQLQIESKTQRQIQSRSIKSQYNENKKDQANNKKQQSISVFKITQAQCLAHLVSILKIFLQAAILSDDEKNLLNLIASSSTSPFKKQRIQQNAQNCNQTLQNNEIMSSNNSVGETHSDKDASSVATAKFANSFTQNIPFESARSATEDRLSDQNLSAKKDHDDNSQSSIPSKNKTVLGQKNFSNNADVNNQNNNLAIGTQVDDFPKLIEQMNQGGLAKKIIQSIDFASFISKILKILQISTSYFNQINGLQSNIQNNQGQRNQQKSFQVLQSSILEDPDPILVQNCLDILLPCLLWNPSDLISQLYQFQYFQEFLVQGLLKSQSEKIRKCIEQNFKTLCYYIDDLENKKKSKNKNSASEIITQTKQEDQLNEQRLNPKQFLLQILFENLPKSMVKGKFKNLEGEFYEEFFNLLSALIKICKDDFYNNNQENENQIDGSNQEFFNQEKQKFQAVNILNFCIDQLKLNQQIIQGQIVSIDNKKPNGPKISAAERQLCGYLQLCQSLLEVLPELKEKAASQCNLITIITDFILNINTERISDSSAIIQKIPNTALIKQSKYFESKQLGRSTKKKAFGLLLTLCEKTEVNFTLTLKILYKFYEKVSQSWQYLDLKELDSEVGIKQSSGYVGLKNFGCTCYMNSLLQQLFMIPSLRKEVLEIDSQSQDVKQNIPKDENLLFQLQSVFANLQESEKSYFAPKGFVSAFKFYGEPVNVRVQQDTHEFYNVLCDQIEQLIPNIKNSKEEDKQKQQSNNFLKRTIGGTLCNQTKSLESSYPYVGEREEDFYAITLDIKNKKTIQEALDLYIKPDILEGENKYHCEQYDRKISAQRRSYLKDLSNTVAINLKRFEFDFNTMQRLKVNDYCEFPERINFKKWTKEGILEEERKEAGDEKENNQTNQDQESFEYNSEDDGEENVIDEEEQKNNLNQNYIIEAAVGGEQMDQGIDFNDDEVQSVRFKNKQNKFEISETVVVASGGSRSYKKRRVRSSNKKRSQDKERLLQKQQSNVNQITTKKRAEDTINLSRQLSDKDSSPIRNRQVKSIGIRDFKTEKEQAIIDEDAFSEDAQSVNSQDKSIKIKQEIDIQRALTKKQKKNKNRAGLQENALTKREEGDTKKIQNERNIDQYEYQLVGVLVHSGSADAGHYYSYIKERNPNSQNYGKWFEFNDTTVKHFNIQNLKKECFGGQGNSNRGTDIYNENIDNENKNKQQFRVNERCCNAYLIFYERVNCIPDTNSISEFKSKERHLQNIFNQIHQQNQSFKHLKMFSDNDFVKFMKDYINLCSFLDVLYFSENFSESAKMASYRELTEHYAKDWNSQMRKALRLQETQELKGEMISPMQIQLKKNYFQEQILIKQNSSESNIFNINQSGQDIDIGLKTIQMATILAQDLLLKLKDTQSFVQLLQKLNQMYQSHAVACVWFIKWITEEDSILQEILLASNYPEVRESFAILISTTFGITIMNEEKYLNSVDQFCDFECDQKTIERGDVNKRRINKSAAFRLVKLFIHRIIDQAKVYWRNYDDFFNLLKDFAQSHFQVAAYLIERGLIGILLEFIMNNKVPFYNSQGGQLFRMGDSISQPNFQHVYSLYSYLIKCCLTKGITAVKHYSPYSVFQEDNKSIMLPEDNIAGFLTPECVEEIVEVSLTCSDAQNQSVEEIIGHLSWGDIKVSQFFLKEFIKHIRIKKGQINILQALMNPIKAILKLDDSKVLKKQRMDFILSFGENIMSHQYISEYQYQQFRNSSMSSYNLGLVNFLFKVKDQYPIYLLIILNFIGKLATTDHKDQIIKEKLVEIKAYFQDWVWIFLHRIVDDSLLASRAKSKFNIQLVILAEQTILSFAEIFDIKDQQNQSSQENKNQVQINIQQTQIQIDILQTYNQNQNNKLEEVQNFKNFADEKIQKNQKNINQESQIFEYYETDGEEESIFKLIPDEKQESQQSFVSLNNQINENPRIATHKGNSFEMQNHIEENQNDYLDEEHII